MKIIRIVLVILVVIIACSGFFGFKAYKDKKTYDQQVQAINISNVDLSKIKDGVYKGSCEVIWVAADVQVTVKDHKITNIELLKHKNGKGQPAEVIPGEVIKAQSLEVDVVSGATSSSKVILKAIENALNSGRQ